MCSVLKPFLCCTWAPVLLRLGTCLVLLGLSAPACAGQSLCTPRTPVPLWELLVGSAYHPSPQTPVNLCRTPSLHAFPCAAVGTRWLGACGSSTRTSCCPSLWCRQTGWRSTWWRGCRWG